MANQRLCSIPSCGKPLNTKGYCRMHYVRFLRHGDPLIGRAPNGEPFRFFSDEVLNYEGQECLIWPYSRNPGGYAVMNYKGAARLVSRLVCEKLYGEAPERLVAAHECNNGHLGCVAKSHLRWKTYLENSDDTLRAGNLVHGEKHPHSKLTKSDVIEIQALIGTIPNKEIATRFGVRWQTISKIKHGRLWSHITRGRTSRN